VRVFLDTNVLVSGIATRGLCNEIVEGVLHDHVLVTCEAVLIELERVLLEKLRLPPPVVADFLGLLREQAELAEAQRAPSRAIPDRDDVPIVACALGAHVDLFVTGDKALLDLESIDGLAIVPPREAWTRLAGL
jgi:putative PIN family toxin of toxin-antitoxin system